MDQSKLLLNGDIINVAEVVKSVVAYGLNDSDPGGKSCAAGSGQGTVGFNKDSYYNVSCTKTWSSL